MKTDIPHARGPAQIGMEDTGPQEHPSSAGQVLDIDAAVGRTREHEQNGAQVGQPGGSMDGDDLAALDSQPQPQVASDRDTDEDGDVVLVDVDGMTPEERDKAPGDGPGPDAIDTTGR